MCVRGPLRAPLRARLETHGDIPPIFEIGELLIRKASNPSGQRFPIFAELPANEQVAILRADPPPRALPLHVVHGDWRVAEPIRLEVGDLDVDLIALRGGHVAITQVRVYGDVRYLAIDTDQATFDR